MIDVSSFVGPYPFRYVPHPEPSALVRVLEREGIAGAWVGHLPSAFYRDPSSGNGELFRILEPHAGILHPVPAVRPDWPRWEHALRSARDAGAPAVRAYPPQWGLGPHDSSMRELVLAASELGMAVVLTVRFEDLRQRHALDVAGDLSAAAVRALARAGERVRLVVSAAGRDMIEEVHWGLTTAEQQRLFWDIAWIWGPPEDQLAKLFRTIGSRRFVFGTQWPLRLAQNPIANLALLPDDVRSMPLSDASDIVSSSAIAEPRRPAADHR